MKVYANESGGTSRAGRFHALRMGFAAFSAIAGALTFACVGAGDETAGSVHVLTAKGVVNPVMDRYIDRGIDEAEESGATAVVIRLDTPGGLVSSTDEITKRILDSDVPVVVYLWPDGAQAASAGTYITYASHVAAMAPGTVIGSATPVSAGGGDIEGDLRNKVIENAAAKLREYAELRGRNADWADRAVREGISSGQDEAVEMDVVDLGARDLDALLNEIDGRSVQMPGDRQVVLRTADAKQVFNNRNWIERFLNVIADPNIAFLLLSLGSLALFIEILNPGSIFPGVFGVISLLLAFFALSVLPFNWAGVALIMTAFILFGLEIFIVSHGVLGVGGAVALIFGGLILTSGNPPEFQVSKWLVFGLAAAVGLFAISIVINAVRIRMMPAKVGMETVVGRQAVVRSPLNPRGFVWLNGEYWSAEVEEGAAAPGEKVIITEVNGLKVKVRKELEGETT